MSRREREEKKCLLRTCHLPVGHFRHVISFEALTCLKTVLPHNYCSSCHPYTLPFPAVMSALLHFFLPVLPPPVRSGFLLCALDSTPNTDSPSIRPPCLEEGGQCLQATQLGSALRVHGGRTSQTKSLAGPFQSENTGILPIRESLVPSIVCGFVKTAL